MPGDDLPPAAYAAALASLEGLGPARLRHLLARASPPAAWAEMRAGGRWAAAARQVDVAALWAHHRELGIDVLVAGDARYPAVLAGDDQAPAVLFAQGDPGAVDRFPRVAVVGTRGATRYGLGVAAELGAALASAGVAVVSGLALGIDGAAHEGAVAAWCADRSSAAPPVGVVAGGLDVPYPAGHARLWRRVAEAGALLSDAAVGLAVPRWRFPQRNRVMAALSQVVVVVECHVGGGSLHTVRAAAARGVAVGAVPGSVRSPASAGTNDLLADGCFVVRDVSDVLVALSLARAGDVPVRPRRRAEGGEAGSGPDGSTGNPEASSPTDPADSTDPAERAVLEALDWDDSSLERLLRRTGLPLAELSATLERLRAAERARGDGGWWARV